MNGFDDAGMLGREAFDNGMKTLTALSRSAQAILTEAAGYSKSACESGAAALEKFLAAGSVESAMAIQTDYARQLYEDAVAEANRIGSLYVDMAKEAYRPFEAVVARPR